MNFNYSSLRTLYYLLAMDFSLFYTSLWDKLIDLAIWVSTTVCIFHYIMPYFGLTTQYTGVMIGGLCASAGLFEVWPRIMGLLSDFEGPRVINYYATLPIPSWLIFVRFSIFYAAIGTLLTAFVVPFAKLFVWSDFALTQVNIPALFFMICTANIFYGAFTIFVVSFVKNLERVGAVWMRLIYPLWCLGGFQFTWHSLYKVLPVFAYIILGNPLTYTMEGMRAATLGQDGFLSIPLCIAALLLFAVLALTIGTIRLKKRFDFV